MREFIDARRNGTRRHIWLCADDYRISPAVNVAIRDLVVRGRINATSVMVVAPSFYRSNAGLSQHSQCHRDPRCDRAACYADGAISAAEPQLSTVARQFE
jgi:hypothetical protein